MIIVNTISVLICTYNRARLLRETLAAIQAQQPPDGCAIEVLVVDNNSTDNTPAVVAESSADGPYRVVALKEAAQGKSFALNTGLAHASGEVVALTDDDVVPAADWLRRIVTHFRTRDVTFVFGKVLPRWGRTPPPELLTPEAQAIWGPLAIVDYGDGAAEYLPESESQRLPVGANLAFARAALVTVGGWRTDLGKVDNTLVSGEDHEIFMRLRRFGLYRGYYDPLASVQHFVPAARLTRAYFRRWFFWHGKTQALMLDDLYPELDFSRVPRVAGAPRFAFRQAVQQLWRCLRSRADGDAVNALKQELYLIEYAGLFAQCWQLWRRGMTAPPKTARTVNAAARALMLIAIAAAAALPAAATRVELSIHDGRVWLAADHATAAEILAEWARVGGTEIANADRMKGEPLTLRLDGLPEAAALEVVLRTAAGYAAIDRDAAHGAPRAASRYARIVVLATAMRPADTSSATSAPPASAPTAAATSAARIPIANVATTAPIPDTVEVAPGVRHLIGADGLPVPDDQSDAPPASPAPPTAAAPHGRGAR